MFRRESTPDPFAHPLTLNATLFVPPPDYKEMKIPGLPFGAPKQ